jgi:hypothetical protein
MYECRITRCREGSSSGEEDRMFLFKTSKGNEYDEKSKKLLSANLLFFLSPRTLSPSIYSLLELFSRTNFCFNFPTDFIAKLTPLTYLNQPVRRSPHFLRYLLLNDALLSAQSSGTVYPSHAPDLLSFMAFSLPCIGHPHIHNSPPSHADIRHAYQCITLLAWAPLPTPY